MDGPLCVFSESALRRTAAVVRAYERDPQRLGYSQRSPSGSAPQRTNVRGKLDGTLSQGGSATLSVWYHNGTTDVDSGEDLTVYDQLLTTGQTIATGKKIFATLDQGSGRYYVTAAECS